MSSSLLPPDREQLLGLPLFAHVGLTAPDGTPRSFPMWFRQQDDRYLFTTTRDRPQCRWLSPGDNFAISVMSPDNPYRYAGIGLRLVQVREDPHGDFFYELAARYSLTITLSDTTSRVILVAARTRTWFQ